MMTPRPHRVFNSNNPVKGIYMSNSRGGTPIPLAVMPITEVPDRYWARYPDAWQLTQDTGGAYAGLPSETWGMRGQPGGAASKKKRNNPLIWVAIPAEFWPLETRPEWGEVSP